MPANDYDPLHLQTICIGDFKIHMAYSYGFRKVIY